MMEPTDSFSSSVAAPLVMIFVFSHVMTLPCASTLTRNEDKDRAIGSSRATDSNSDLALGRIVMIAFFSLVRDDLNVAGASGVIRSMNTGFCSIIPEAWTKRSLIEVFSRSRILM
jgi:hypothetical protein